MSKSKENLESAKENYNDGRLGTSVNRSYYAVFHACRAVNALDGFDSKKHSGVISYFNKNFIKTGALSKDLSKIIRYVRRIREDEDYEDFYYISDDDAMKQLNMAIEFVNCIETYLSKTIGDEEL